MEVISSTPKYDQNIDEVFESLFNKNIAKKNEEYSLFRQGASQRSFWPHEIAGSEIKVSAQNAIEWQLKNNELIFKIDSANWVDPYSCFFNFDIVNNNTEPMFIDDSAHSIISAMYIYVNGNELERYEDYPLLAKLYNDFFVSKDEKEARAGEFFYKMETANNQVTGTPAKLTSKPSNNKPILFEGVKKTSNALINNSIQSKAVRFKIPFMSKFFGVGVEKKNWKLVPMQQMNLVIKLVLSNNCFFTLNDLQEISNIKVENPKFVYTEYIFDNEFNQMQLNKFANGLKYDYLDFEIVEKYSIKNNPLTLNLSFNFKTDHQHVRAILFFVQDQKFKKSTKYRQTNRVNLGYSLFQMFTTQGYWPQDKFFDNYEVYNYGTDRQENSIVPLIISFKDLLKGVDYPLSDFTTNYTCFNNIQFGLRADLNLLSDVNSGYKDLTGTHLNMIRFDNLPRDKDNIVSGITLNAGENYSIRLSKHKNAYGTTGLNGLIANQNSFKDVLESISPSEKDPNIGYLVLFKHKQVTLNLLGEII